MIVCIDTNVLLQAAKTGHAYEIIMQGWLSRRYQWAHRFSPNIAS